MVLTHVLPPATMSSIPILMFQTSLPNGATCGHSLGYICCNIQMRIKSGCVLLHTSIRHEIITNEKGALGTLKLLSIGVIKSREYVLHTST